MRRPSSWRIQTKTIVLAGALVLVVLLVTAVPVLFLAAGSLEGQVGTRALDIARTLAASPVLQEAFYLPDPIREIAPMADQIRRATEADYVMVLDRSGRRYSAPVPEHLGTATAALDYGPALMEGKEFYTRLQEGRISALTGVAPVYGQDGELVGLVSVGFRLEGVAQLIRGFSLQVGAMAAVGLAIGAAGAFLLARHIKQQIWGLEPPQIAALLEERTSILESVREGIIAIDEDERVTMANHEARRILSLADDPVGRLISELIPNSLMPTILQTGEAHYDQEMILGGRVVVVNRVPMRHAGRVVGVVSSFRDRTELNELVGELTAARRYSEALRAQAHEFNNRLHAVAGLLQLGAIDEALEYILRSQGEHQHLLDLLVRLVPDPMVEAIIMGKYNRAAELHVRFELDPASQFDRAVKLLGTDLLITVLGNLLDNAIEAVQGLPEDRRWVRLCLTDQGPEIRISVVDGGPGVPPEMRARIFGDGFSTKKGKGRGFGLALVHLLVTQAGGRITVDGGDAAPSRFLVTFEGGA